MTLDNRAINSNESKLMLVTKPQKLTTIFNYLDQNEMALVKTSPLPTAVHIMCCRMKMLGITSLKEKTKKATVAFLIQLLVARGEARPTANEIYKLGQYLYDAFDCCIQAPLVPGLATYPSSPLQIGGVPWKQ